MGRAFSAEVNCQISAIELHSGKIRIKYSGSKPAINKFQLEGLSPGQKRLVADFKKTKFAVGSYKQEFQNFKIRASQLSNTPSVVRVVFEGPSPEIENIKLISHGKEEAVFRLARARHLLKPQSKSSKPSSIYSVTWEGKELILEGDYAVETSHFELKKDEELLFVTDIKKANLSKNNLGKRFSKLLTQTSEQIRVAQFEPGTVRVVIEGQKARDWQSEIFKDGRAIRFFKTKQSSDQLYENRNPKKKTKSGLQASSANKVVLKSQKPIKYKVFQLSSPERLVLDLYSWDGDLEALRATEVNSSIIKKIRTGKPKEDEDISRVVFELQRKNLSFSDRVSEDKKTLYLSLFDKSTQALMSELKKSKKKFKVVIDAGHGGHDSGAIHSGAIEKDISLGISKKLAAILKTYDVQVLETRKKDEFVSLDDRVEESKKARPDLFLSVHCNALERNSQINGIETYYFSPESYKLAEMIHANLTQKTKAPGRKIQKARFVVIKDTDYPSVLAEVGFLSNPNERNKLKTSSYQDKVAEGLANGILRYLTH